MSTLGKTTLQLDMTADTAEKRDHFGLAGWTGPGATVDLLQDGVKLTSVIASETGRFAFQLAEWPAFGHHVFSAIARNADGQSSASNLLDLDLGASSPRIPTLSSPLVFIHSEDNYVYGVSTPAATIRVLSDGALLTSARADESGFWHVALPSLNEGVYRLTATATSNTGTSSASAPWVVIFDWHTPEAPRLVFGNGVQNGAPNALSDDWVAFSGTAEAGVRLELSVNGVLRGMTRVGNDGLWALQVGLPVGSYVATASAIDDAKNRSVPSQKISFTVSATEDSAADDSTGANLAIGSSVQGMIDQFGDHDWYKVRLDAKKLYQFTLTAAESNAGTLKLPPSGSYEELLHLWDTSSQSQIVSVGRTSQVSEGAPLILKFAPTSSGDYFLDMGAKYITGSYTLNALVLASDDHANDNQHATALPLDSKLDGVINYAGDIDRFALTLQAGVSYAVTLDSGGVAYGKVYRWLELSGGPEARSEHLPSPWDGFGTLSMVASVDGVYYLSASGGTGDAVPYHLLLSKSPDDFPANSASTGRVLPDALASGTLESSVDADWFRATITAGTSYLLEALTPQREALNLALFDASGQALRFADNTVYGADAILWQAPGSGDYFFQVKGNRPGAYTLRVTPAPADDFGDSILTAGSLTSGASVSGVLEVPRDVDYFKVALHAGSDYVFAVDSGKSGRTLPAGGQLQLFNSSGQILLEVTGTGGSSSTQLVFHAPATADYYLAMSDSMPHIGNYSIAMSASNQDTASANASTTSTLSPNQVVPGNIDFATDVDWYRVDMKANHWYHFELTGDSGRGGTLPSHTLLLNLLDANSQQIATQNINLNVDRTLSYYPHSDATYYLAIAATNNATGSYTLKTSRDYDRFPDTLPPLYKSISTPRPGSVLEAGESLYVHFDETVKLGSGAITLRLATGELVESFNAGAENTSLPPGLSGLTLSPKPLAYSTDYVLTLAPGSVVDYNAHPFAGKEIHFRTPDSPVRQVGGAGNDLLPSIANNDFIDGKEGRDSAIIRGQYDHYQIRKTGEIIKVDRYAILDGAPDRHTLRDIERLLFDDGAIAYDIDGNAGKAYRLYQAAFDRQPDLDGLGFWIAQLDQNTTLDSVARGFIQSSEFIARYGSAPSDQEFVAGLYQNVLHRQSDQGGVDFWNSKLHDGISRSEVLMAFSESPENQAALIGKIGNGISYHLYG